MRLRNGINSIDANQRRLIISEAGATGIEYAFIACFIAIAISIGVGLAGNGLNKMFYIIGDKMMNASNTAQSSN